MCTKFECCSTCWRRHRRRARCAARPPLRGATHASHLSTSLPLLGVSLATSAPLFSQYIPSTRQTASPWTSEGAGAWRGVLLHLRVRAELGAWYPWRSQALACMISYDTSVLGALSASPVSLHLGTRSDELHGAQEGCTPNTPQATRRGPTSSLPPHALHKGQRQSRSRQRE